MKKKTPLPAKITVGIATTGIIVMGLGVIRENGTVVFAGLALTLIGFFASFVVSAIISVKSKSANPQYGSKSAVPLSNTAAVPYSSDPVISRILANPYVLLDERIRQIHEVQNLLQYPEIQRIFFEPEKLHSLFAQERVGELLNVVRDWITRNNAEEIFAAAEMRRPVNSVSRTNKTAQMNRPDKSTMIGVILTVIIWLFLFAAAASAVLRHL